MLSALPVIICFSVIEEPPAAGVYDDEVVVVPSLVQLFAGCGPYTL